MPSVAELLNEGAGRLISSSDSPGLDAQVLLAHVMGKSRTWLYTWPEKTVSDSETKAYRALLSRRVGGEPIAHVVANREFWSLSLKVNPSTLIPRPDTELAVEFALSRQLPPGSRVLDLGTGTGAIALALACERPAWYIEAVDKEAAAVALARENAAALGLPVTVYQSDWLVSVEGKFELIVSNPPYIAPDDPCLTEGDVRFEPRSALVAGDNGLADLRHIIERSVSYLAQSGWLLVEHGSDQGGDVRELFIESGYVNVATVRDLAGHERLTAGQKV